MPLLGRQPFQRQKLKINTQQLDKQYFYCKHTQEIFLDYESLFQRVIQCNSLVWTCSLTGRAGLTFQEAVESEKKARGVLATFPEPLKQPVLYIATLTNRNRIGDLCDDVYYYIRDRFFVGEKVELILEGDRKVCEVTAVCPPGKSSKSPKKNGTPTKEPPSDPGKQQYELCETDDADEIQICRVVDGKDLSRPKGLYTKTTNKLFIKQHVTLKDGTLVVKDSSVKKYELDSPTLKSITDNKKPDFANLPKSNSPKSKNGGGGGQMDIKKAFNQKNGSKKTTKGALSPEDVKKRFEEQRLKKLEEKEKEKEQMREEKLLIAKFKLEWNKPRDDLECDDLKDLPVATKIKCNIPDEVFGDALMILEFVQHYAGLLKAKRTYPHGLTFETLEKSLINTDIDGPFNDLLQMFLLAVLTQQEEEGEEQVGLKESEKKIDHESMEEDMEDLTTKKALLAAKLAATWPQYHHGTILRKMPLDSFTLTEMLRLHLMASGSEVFPRFNERGMYMSQENPGLYFKMEHPEIMKLLATSSVFQLNPAQRVKLVNVLMAQLLTYETFRDHIEESAKNLKNAQYALKQLRWARSRRGKEDKNKKKPEKAENADEKPPKPELTAEEKAEEDAKFMEQSLKKEKELLSQIDKLKGVSVLHPIGLDRAYRRYWAFKSVGGIFVEDNDPFVGICQPRPTPSQPSSMVAVKKVDELPLSFMRKYLSSRKKESDKNGQSDKENEAGDVASASTNHNHSKPQKLLSDANPRINSPLKVNQRHSSSASSDSNSDEKDVVKKDFVCHADPVLCPVHGNGNAKPKVEWSFFHTEEQINNLIAALNPRGYRENALKEALVKEKVAFFNNVATCPVDKLNRDIVSEEPVIEIRKSNRKASVFHNIPPEEALISTFRDALLENEEKLWSGSLGFVKVKDRKLWRETISDGKYDMQTDYVKYGLDGKRFNGESVDKMDVDDEKMSDRSSSPSLVASPVIVDLALALLQVAQGVESKYIVPPLADDDKYKKLKQKQIEKQEKYKASSKSDTNQDDQVTEVKGLQAKSPFQRWEESLMNSTSISQLFIHLATLERSITWRKAAKNASCRICRKRGDPENMLLCDQCDKGYHMYCLKPSLSAIPTGQWYCPPCEPTPVLPKEPRKATKSYKELSDSEGEEEEEEEEEDEEQEEVEDEEEDEVQEDEEEQVEDEEEEDDDDDDVVVEEDDSQQDEEDDDEVEEDDDDAVNLDESDEDEEEEENSLIDETDFCLVCKIGGDLLMCDNCPGSYHLKCCTPPLKKVPKGKWFCATCVSNQEKEAKAKKERKDKEVEKVKEKEKETSKGTRASNKRKASSPPREDTSSGSRSNRRSSNEKKGLPLDYNCCSNILTALSQHQHSWPFMRAVSKKEAPDYHKIIKRPIDLGIIRSKLNNQKYANNSQFTADVYLMFQNCEVYNAANTQQYQSGKGLARYFQSLLRKYKLIESSTAENGLGERDQLPTTSSKRSRY